MREQNAGAARLLEKYELAGGKITKKDIGGITGWVRWYPKYYGVDRTSDEIVFDDAVTDKKWAATQLAIRLVWMMEDSASEMRKSYDRGLDEEVPLPERAANLADNQTSPLFGRNTTSHTLETFGETLVWILEAAPVIGTAVSIGELSSGQKLAFTANQERALSTGEKIWIGTTVVGGTVVFAMVSKVGNKFIAKLIGKTDEAVEEAVDAAESVSKTKKQPVEDPGGGSNVDDASRANDNASGVDAPNKTNVPGPLPAPTKGQISGDVGQLLDKNIEYKAGKKSTVAEIRAARAFASEGENVHFIPTEKTPNAPKTADFSVGGKVGTGEGGVSYEVVRPNVGGTINEAERLSDLVGSVVRKARHGQSPRLVVDVTDAQLSTELLKDVLRRANLSLKASGSAKQIEAIRFLSGEEFVLKLP